MSYITEVVILMDFGCQMPVELQRWLEKNGDGTLQRISLHRAGGSKVFTSEMWAGAFNYLPGNFLRVARTSDWGDEFYAQQVRILINRTDDGRDEGFITYRVDPFDQRCYCAAQEPKDSCEFCRAVR